MAVGAAASGGGQEAGRTVRERVYSSQQAERGRELFESICTSCHELAEFTGSGAYLESVEGESLWDTFEYVAAEMPEDDPGSLEPADYAAVLAYLLSTYGLPSGANALPADRESLEALVIAPPKPPDG